MRTVTLDTNVADCREVIEAAQRRGLEIAVVSVTDREMSLSAYRPGVDARVLESIVFGESKLGQMVLGPAGESELFEQVLQIISNGSFPKPDSRDHLTPLQRRQLRDAMILVTHVRVRRDILVSNDTRAFLRHGRREALESLVGTRIMTSAEFLQWVEESS
jgi:hypothetical protein